jgi:branched-chain amino acid transport system permease protein
LDSILFQQSFWSGITIGFVYALIALGFNIIFNVNKVLNIAQGEFVMFGALCLYSFVSVLNVPVWIAVLFTLFVACFLGFLMVNLAINPLKKPNILSLIIVTIAFGEIIKGIAVLIWGSEHYPIPQLITSTTIPVFSAKVDSQTFLIIGVTIVVFVIFSLINKFTKFGKSMTAIAGDAYAAQLVGINVKKMLLIVFMIGSVMGAIGGILIGPLTSMSYTQGTLLGIKAFIAALIGGLGSYGGAIIGGITLGLFEAYAAGYISSLYKEAFSFLILLILLIFLPNGLVDLNKIWKRN